MAIAAIQTWLNDPHRTYNQGKQLYDEYGKDLVLKILFNAGNDRSLYHLQRLKESLTALNDAGNDPGFAPAWPTKKYINDKYHRIESLLQKGTIYAGEYQQKPIPGPPSSDHTDALELLIAKSIDIGKRPQAIPFTPPAAKDIPVSMKRYAVNDQQWEQLPEQIKDLHRRNIQLNDHSKLLFAQSRATEHPASRLKLDLQILNERDQINKNWRTIKDYHERGVILVEIKAAAVKTVEQMSITEMVAASKNIPTYVSKARKRLEKTTDAHKQEDEHKKIKAWELQLEEIRKRLEAGK